MAYLNITLLVYQQVLGLQVSVDEVQGVKVLEGEYDLSCIKSGVVFAATRGRGGELETKRSQALERPALAGDIPEPSDASEVREHFPTGNVLHHHVEV